MSFLSAAFALGAAAIAFPVLFHLIRRTPREKQEFSSLMFLEPSPPVLTRRSRLDEVLLLLLRSLALLLLAIAFMRPFWRSDDALSLENVRGRRIVILVDTSASMRRDGIWDQATKEVEAVLDDLSAADSTAIVTFDRSARIVADYNVETADVAIERTRLTEAFSEIAPTWFETKFDTALLRAIDLLNDQDDESSPAARQIVLISDLQSGGSRDDLQKLDWPADIPVDVRRVVGAKTSNATLRVIEPDPEDADVDGVKVRLSNSTDAETTNVAIQPFSGDRPVETSSKHGVPAGQSRTVTLKSRRTDFDRIQLTGDDAAFDNTWFVARPEPVDVEVGYWGTDSVDDADRLLYYFDRALRKDDERTLNIVRVDSGQGNTGAFNLHLVDRQLDQVETERLVESVSAGTNALVVLQSSKMAEALDRLVGDVRTVDASSTGQATDKLLAEIDFSDPLFSKFASPRFNDFTDIRFWQSVRVTFDDDADIDVIARFDDLSPAIWTRQLGEGNVFVLTSGWLPAASQLALSNKFVPILEAILAQSLPRSLESRGYFVGDVVPIDRSKNSSVVAVRSPDGSTYTLDDDISEFRETNVPGIYELDVDGETSRFAINVSTRESQTSPLEASDFEQLGVLLGVQTAQAAEYDRLRTLRDRELEREQKIWKWAVVVALVFIATETWLSAARSRLIPTDEQTPRTDGVMA